MKVMKYVSLLCIAILLTACSFAQSPGSMLEVGACPVRIGPGVISVCGYLVAPENRKAPSGRKVKVPFIFVRRPEMSATKNVALFTTGGPGYSTTANIDSIGERSGWLAYGGFIAFDQRGSKKSIPNLECPAVTEAIRRSYRTGLNRDSLVRLAVAQSRKEFTAKGIDLSSYTTIESAEDINDLRLLLKIDSLSLVGISYSGGLMMTVARNHPEAVRTLALGSPLPAFVNYEEHALANMNEALESFFNYYDTDSAATRPFGDLRSRFHSYFTGITGKRFPLRYYDPLKRDTIQLTYGKDELMDIILDGLSAYGFKTLPTIMNDLIDGKHSPYVDRVIDGYFSANQSLSHGMRYSIYCSEQIAYSDTALINQQSKLFPWLAGFAFNSPDKAVCDCWKVRPEPAAVKDPVYSNVPVLIAAGDIDPWCSPFYNRLIQRTFPNAHSLIFRKRGHVPGFSADGVEYMDLFLKNPYSRISVRNNDIWSE